MYLLLRVDHLPALGDEALCGLPDELHGLGGLALARDQRVQEGQLPKRQHVRRPLLCLLQRGVHRLHSIVIAGSTFAQHL